MIKNIYHVDTGEEARPVPVGGPGGSSGGSMAPASQGKASSKGKGKIKGAAFDVRVPGFRVLGSVAGDGQIPAISLKLSLLEQSTPNINFLRKHFTKFREHFLQFRLKVFSEGGGSVGTSSGRHARAARQDDTSSGQGRGVEETLFMYGKS